MLRLSYVIQISTGLYIGRHLKFMFEAHDGNTRESEYIYMNILHALIDVRCL